MSLACNKITGTFELDDDSTTKFDWRIRVALKAPNAPMQEYWDQIPNNVSHDLDLFCSGVCSGNCFVQGAQKAAPRRASSLVLTHVMGTSQVNPQVILMVRFVVCLVSICNCFYRCTTGRYPSHIKCCCQR